MSTLPPVLTARIRMVWGMYVSFPPYSGGCREEHVLPVVQSPPYRILNIPVHPVVHSPMDGDEVRPYVVTAHRPPPTAHRPGQQMSSVVELAEAVTPALRVYVPGRPTVERVALPYRGRSMCDASLRWCDGTSPLVDHEFVSSRHSPGESARKPLINGGRRGGSAPWSSWVPRSARRRWRTPAPTAPTRA